MLYTAIFFTNRESDVERCQLQVVCFIVCYTCTNTILVLAAACTLSLSLSIEQEGMLSLLSSMKRHCLGRTAVTSRVEADSGEAHSH